MPPWLPIVILQIFAKDLCFQYFDSYLHGCPAHSYHEDTVSRPSSLGPNAAVSHSEVRRSWQRPELEHRPT